MSSSSTASETSPSPRRNEIAPPTIRIPPRNHTGTASTQDTPGNSQASINTTPDGSTTSQPTITRVPQQSPPTSALPRKVNNTLEESRKNVLSTSHDIALYLGLADARDQVVWYRHGSTQTLITVAALEAFKQAAAEYNPEDDTSPPTSPEPAHLAIIAKISPKGTFLAPDGNYGNSNPKFRKEFEKTQLNIQLECVANHPTLTADFERALDTIKELEHRAETNAKTTKSSIIVPPSLPDEPYKIKLRHNIFRKRTDDDDDDEDTDDNNEGDQVLPLECRIKNWPTNSALAHAALQRIVNSHVAQPLPAYDPSNNNKIILPSQYAKLRGALCFIRFTLTHYAFSDEKGATASKIRDVYVADISSITALHIPQGESTPTKRIAPTDPCSPSPSSKKQRVN